MVLAMISSFTVSLTIDIAVAAPTICPTQIKIAIDYQQNYKMPKTNILKASRLYQIISTLKPKEIDLLKSIILLKIYNDQTMWEYYHHQIHEPAFKSGLV